MHINVHAHLASPKTALVDIQRINSGNTLVFLNTSSPSEFKALYPLVKSSPRIRLALGMHPLLVGSVSMSPFFDLVTHTSYIGEIGLDNSRHRTAQLIDQVTIFERILECISGLDKVAFIHSRNADKESITLLKKYKHEKVVFHWFTGSLKILEELIEYGCYFSLNPKMLFNEKGHSLFKSIPYDRLLPETDTPYSKISDRMLYYDDVSIVYQYISKYYNTSLVKVENDLMHNLYDLIGMNK